MPFKFKVKVTLECQMLEYAKIERVRSINPTFTDRFQYNLEIRRDLPVKLKYNCNSMSSVECNEY